MATRGARWLAGLALCVAVATTARAENEAAAVRLSGEGVTGTLLRHAQFPSRHVPARHVDVWLPPGYADDDGRRYPVLYLHDGQNLFDPSTSYTGVDWGVDEAMTHLIASGQVREAIVVGVWNSPRRWQEYMPRKALAAAQFVPVQGGAPLPTDDVTSDAYLAFLVAELKPFIDARYRTSPGRDDTFVMGSSMGGLISLYALAEYPAVFGGAGGVSTHWPAGEGAVVDYLRTRLPDAGTHRLYFDHGTSTLDAQYEPYQRQVDRLVREKGYAPGRQWITHRFPGAEHSEAAWRERIEVPLAFLLSPDP